MADDLGGLFFRYNLRMIPLSGDEYAALGGASSCPPGACQTGSG